MIRFFGYLFSGLCLILIFGVGGVAGLVWVYGRELPSHAELEDYQPRMMSRVYSGEGRVIAEFATERRLFAPIDEVPDLVKQAFISAEDKNFYRHAGIDPAGIAKALVRFAVSRAEGEDTRLSGASTITQQVMKNFLVGNDRSFERKIKEAILAVRIDGALSKDQILELYLNEIFFGARAYGIVAAAQNYFGKGLEALTPAEVAYLAALPKAPSALHPVRDHDRAVARRNYVLEEMADNGYLTRAEAEAAKAAPLSTRLGGGGAEAQDAVVSIERDYFTEEVRRQLSVELGETALMEGGLAIRATVEPDLQAIAGRAIRRALVAYDKSTGLWRGPVARIEGLDPADWQAALRAVAAPRDIPEWQLAVVIGLDRTGAEIGLASGETARIELKDARAWVKGVARPDGRRVQPASPDDIWAVGDVVYTERTDGVWALRQIPEVQGAFMAMDPHTGRVLALQGGFSFQASVFNRATQALRQPGSSFKPFVYAAALDAGYTPETIVLDAPVVLREAGVDWRPKNSSNQFYGPTPLSTGIIMSRNLMTVRIAQSVGMDRVAEYAERFGVYRNMPHLLSYSLGAGETTLWNMVAAYSMFANGGKQVTPTLVDRVQNRLGETIYRHDPRVCQGCRAPEFGRERTPILFDQRSQIMNSVTAAQIVQMLEGVVTRGTASRTIGDVGFPLAGKTGTTNDNIDAWFVGFSPNIAAGCFIGFDQPKPMGEKAFGGTLCAPVFKEFMVEAMKTRAPGRFKLPEDQGAVLVKLDRVTGERLPDDATGPDVVSEIFQRGTEPELGTRVAALVEDETLFRDVASEFTYLLDQGDLPLQPSGGTGAAGQPAAPTGSVGLGTGGVY